MLRAGAGLGYELPPFKGITVAPYASIHYEFEATAYDSKVGQGESNTTGDTLSHAQIEWGLLGRYRFLFASVANHHSSSHPATPWMSRLLIGFTSGGRNRAIAAPRPWLAR
jgi:hypothetical protein